MQFEVERMLDPIVVWEDINHCRYDPALGKFKVMVKTEDLPGKSHHKQKCVAHLERKLAAFEEQVGLSEKRAS